MPESFKTFQPKSELLRKVIDHYYFHSNDVNGHSTYFTFYPHYKHALTIYKNSKVERKSEYQAKACPTLRGYNLTYTSLINHFAQAEIVGPFNKIGVVFQPLGINHFINGHINRDVKSPFHLDFSLFQTSMKNCLDGVFHEENTDIKVEKLDEYFLSIYNHFKAELLQEAIEIALNGSEEYNVHSLAKELDVSRRTLLRLFRRHLNSSTKDYLKMIKFRKAVKVYQESIKRMNLSDLTYQVNYNDQSEFIHHFKKLTGFSPKSFFENLHTISNLGTYWTLDQKNEAVPNSQF